MKTAEAQVLLLSRRLVTVHRNGMEWHGKIIGIIHEPSLLLEREDGKRIPIALRDATAEETA